MFPEHSSRGCLNDTWKPRFCLTLYLTGVHFQDKLQHVGDFSQQKSVNQSELEKY